jgi:tetratricopeptide (TPR) repeat protein
MRRIFIMTLLAATASAWTRAWAEPTEQKAKPDAPAGMPESLHGHTHDEAQPDAKPFGLGESNNDYFWRKADIAFHAGDFERTIALHKAIVALDPSDVESYSVAAWLMWSLGRGDEAIAHIKRGIGANPNNWEMWDAAGEQYDLQKQFEIAKEAYTSAVRLLPAGDESSQLLRRRLAHAAEHAGDMKLAVSTWSGLDKDFPNDPVNKNNLTRLEKSSGITATSLSGVPASDLLKVKYIKSGAVRYFRVPSKAAL